MQEIQYTPIRSSQVNHQRKAQTRPNRSLERTPSQDSVDIKRAHQKERDKKNQTKGFILGATAMLALLGGGKAAVDNFTPPQADFDTMGNSIVEVADFCDVDPRAIALVNEMELDETADKIIMPQKMDIESDLAEVYTVEGSKYAYIIPNDYGISAQDIKEDFNIEDGVIKKYNDLSYSWGVDTEVEIHQGYKDYTNATIPYEGIKVPLSAIQ